MSTCSWQNWDNLIDYIKHSLGADSMSFEYSDEDILKIVRDHTLPEFSRFVPMIRYYYMREAVNIIRTSPTYVYQFKNFDYRILKINNVITRGLLADMNQFYAFSQADGDVTDFLMDMNKVHMSQMNLAPDTWRFFAPDKLEITHTPSSSLVSRDFIVEVACVHDNPVTVNPDMYMYLKDLALADIMIFLGRIRTKFRQFSTPFGQVELNSEELLQEGKQLKQDTMDRLTNLPPEDFLFFLN